MTITNGVPFITSDGIAYYHVAKSMVDYSSFASPVKPEYYDYKGHVVEFYRGQYVDVVSVGTSLFLVPGLQIAKWLRSPEQTIYTDYFMAYNGHTLQDGFAVLITAVMISLVSIYFMYQNLRLLKFAPRLAMFATFAAYASSYAIWYAILGPAFTHTYELFTLTISLWLWLKYREGGELKFAAALGVGTGMLLLIRPTLAVFGLIFGVYFLYKRDWKALISMAAGAIPMVLIWSAYNYVSYGKIIASGYSEIRGEGFNFNEFNGFKILFSPFRGWFVYSPVFLLAVAGLIWNWKRAKALCSIGLAGVAGVVLTYSFWGAWWGGGSYGARFLLILAPIGAIGLAMLIERARGKVKVGTRSFAWRKVAISLAVFCLAWSVLLTALYRVTPIPNLRPKTDVAEGMLSGDRYTPADIIGYHLNLILTAQSPADYVTKIYKSVSGGVSYSLFPLGLGDVMMRMDERVGWLLKFRILYPPVLRQQVPDQVQAYLVPKDHDAVYLITFRQIEPRKVFSLNCDQICITTDPDVEITKLEDYPTKLNRAEVFGINPDYYDFNLYFIHAANLQVKGPPVVLPNGAEDFVL